MMFQLGSSLQRPLLQIHIQVGDPRLSMLPVLHDTIYMQFCQNTFLLTPRK